MCFERLTHLKCGHYESAQLDCKGCKYQAGRKCPDYVQAVVSVRITTGAARDARQSA